jgi:hypothetical protein
MEAPALKREEQPRLRLAPAPSARIDAIDFARGVAVALMILSHGIKGLLAFEQIPSWGMVPVHLVTKISSSLFILVFGISLAVVYEPHVGTDRWPEKRKRLLIRALKVFFWYKILTIAEMTPLYSREDIIKTLLYQAFPVYVEILGFYAIALAWVAFFLPLWRKLPKLGQLALPVATAFAGIWLYHHFDFWGSDVLQALLVEHPKHYTWGQIARAPLVFLGLLIGARIVAWRKSGRRSALMPAFAFLAVAVALLAGFLFISFPTLRADLLAIAKNEGKHPPELKFMLFSLGGAFLALAIAFAGGKVLAHALKPITLIGQDALQSFICHIFVIFVIYRYLLNYWHQVSYEQALGLTAAAMAVTALWIQVLHWLDKSQRLRSS